MPGFRYAGLNPGGASTPHRRTHVRFDTPITAISEPAFELSRTMLEIGAGQTKQNQVIFDKGLGWRLQAYQDDISFLYERSVADSSVITPAQMTLAPGFLSIPQFRPNSDLTGVPAGLVRTGSGDTFIGKEVTAGGTWDSSLSADQTAFPSPDSGNDSIPLDRVAVTASNHLPNEGLTLRFSVPNTRLAVNQRILTIYFSGVAGQNDALDGFGQYALVLQATGYMFLYERGLVGGTGSAVWKNRGVFKWAEPQKVNGDAFALRIQSDARFENSRWVGTSITFSTYSSISEGFLVPLIDEIFGVAGFPTQTSRQTYIVPNDGKRTVATQVQPNRIDMRRDLRVHFQISKNFYYTSGDLTDEPFSFLGPPMDAGAKIRIQLFGSTPTGTSVDVKLYDVNTGTELTVDSNTTYTNGRLKVYNPPADSSKKNFYCKFFFTGTTTLSPYLTRYTVVRDAVVRSLPGSNTEAINVRGISILGPGKDPSTERAEVQVEDETAVHTILKTKANFPIVIETEYDPNNPSARSVLFQGYMSQADGLRKGRERTKGFSGNVQAQYPSPEWTSYVLKCTGEWQRLRERLAPTVYNFAISGESDASGSPKPEKVTTAIRSLLGCAGYTSSQLDIPDVDIRFWGKNTQEIFIEPFSPIDETILRFARDYLGAFLIWDPNSGSKGKWRLKFLPKAPYKNLAEFLLKPQGTGLAHTPGAYPSTYNGAQEIKRTFVRAKTLRTKVIPPEGNVVVVSGSGFFGSLTAVPSGGEVRRLTKTAYNWVSNTFWANQPIPEDPTHPDHLGRTVPILYLDPSLVTEEAVSWTCRRLFDVSAHARKVLNFEAPAILIKDVEDTDQRNPRLLRYGDPVLVEGTQFFVYDCTPVYRGTGRDRFQHAMYELHAPSNA